MAYYRLQIGLALSYKVWFTEFGFEHLRYAAFVDVGEKMRIQSMRRLGLIGCLLLSFLVGCGQTASEEIGYGSITESHYQNDYFGFEIQVPEGWSVQSQAEQQALMEMGAELLAGDDEGLKNVMKASEAQTVSLFTFMKHEVGAPVTFNPSIIGLGERVASMPGIKRGEDYFFHARKLLEQGQIPYEFPQAVFSQKVAGFDFDVMPAEVTMVGVTIYQQYFAARIKDYMLVFILSYSNDEEFQELQSRLATLKRL